jgi:hypothetical protein
MAAAAASIVEADVVAASPETIMNLTDLRQELEHALVSLARASNVAAEGRRESVRTGRATQTAPLDLDVRSEEARRRADEAERRATSAEARAAEAVKALEDLSAIASKLQTEVLSVDKEKLR